MSHEIDSPQFLVHHVGIHPFHTEIKYLQTPVPDTLESVTTSPIHISENGGDDCHCCLPQRKGTFSVQTNLNER